MRGRAAATSAEGSDHSETLRRARGVVARVGRHGGGETIAQRVRVGLTGLAAIFLAVLIAAAGMRPVRSWQPSGAPGEPLAVLGVAPGAGPASPAPAEAPPPARPTRG